LSVQLCHAVQRILRRPNIFPVRNRRAVTLSAVRDSNSDYLAHNLRAWVFFAILLRSDLMLANQVVCERPEILAADFAIDVSNSVLMVE